MILIYDTETTGLVNSREPAEHPSQPHLVQLGALLLTDTGREIAGVDLTVKPNGWTIPEGAAKAHGITTGIANEVGVPLATVLSCFAQLRAIATEAVAFNDSFDRIVMQAAFHRHGKQPSHPGPDKQTCAMTLATPICNLPPTARMKAAGFNKNKPPNLTEAYRFLCGQKDAAGAFVRSDLAYPWLRTEDGGFAGAHSAINDCRATAEILFEIRRRWPDGAPAPEVPF